MTIWVWFSRVTLLGLVGTIFLASVIFSIQSKRKNPGDGIRAAALTPQEAQVLQASASPTSTATTQLNRALKSGGNATALSRPFDLRQSLTTYSFLFATPTSLGMVAIGVAEGNYKLVVKDGTLYVQQNPSYFGHVDPGNLSWGERVTNYGPCSDQGRSRGNIPLAEQICLERARNQLPTQLFDLNAAGVNPEQNIESLLNVADLYNQASPIASRHFPKALAIALRGGLRGVEAIAWARTASFYLNANNELDVERGTNQATGLLGICAREGRVTTEWQCVYEDQRRRVDEIASVVEKYRRLAKK